jgi:hypothetical protein
MEKWGEGGIEKKRGDMKVEREGRKENTKREGGNQTERHAHLKRVAK